MGLRRCVLGVCWLATFASIAVACGGGDSGSQAPTNVVIQHPDASVSMSGGTSVAGTVSHTGGFAGAGVGGTAGNSTAGSGGTSDGGSGGLGFGGLGFGGLGFGGLGGLGFGGTDTSGGAGGVPAGGAGGAFTDGGNAGGSGGVPNGGAGGIATGGRDGGTPLPIATGRRIDVDNNCCVEGLACWIRDSGELYCWGSNKYSIFGAAGPDQYTPKRVGTELWTTIQTNDQASALCGIRQDGTIWCWGRGSALLFSSTLITTGTPRRLSDPGPWSDLAVGAGVACAIKASDSSLWCWGSGSTGALGQGCAQPTGPCTGPSSVTPLQVPGAWSSVDIANDKVVAADKSGNIWLWGDYKYTPSKQTGTWFGPWRQVARGSTFAGIKADQSLWRGYPPGSAGAGHDWVSVDVAGLNEIFCAVDATEGGVWCWGSNNSGQFGNGDWDPLETASEPQRVPGTSGFLQVSMGTYEVCALRQDDTVWCWGTNRSGVLGDGGLVSRSIPWQVGVTAPPQSCTNGIADGDELHADCGTRTSTPSGCPVCPTCTDKVMNGLETDVDCGGPKCALRCATGSGCTVASDCACVGGSPSCDDVCVSGKCASWCYDIDRDGYGNQGDGCLGKDCDERDAAYHDTCWIRDLFPKPWPRTVTVNGTVTKQEQICLWTYSGLCYLSGCGQNGYCTCSNPPDKTEPIQLDLTVNADGTYSIEAPYNSGCNPDTLCVVSGPGCNVPTTYDPGNYFLTFTPKPTAYCIEDPIDFHVDFSISNGHVNLTQDCTTRIKDNPAPPSPSPVTRFDLRNWTVTIDLTNQP
jgi:hypothetical protein